MMYEKNPEDIKFDTKFSKFNTPKSEEEYIGLKSLINTDKQQDPILIRSGLCGDGVHRVKIAKELNRKVLCIDIDPNIPDKDYILLCNKNTIGARNLNPSQKAIRGYKLVKEFSYTDTEASMYLGIKDRRTIGYVRTIADSPYAIDNNIIEKLNAGESVFISGKWTKSIDTAKRLIKMIEEEDMRKEVENKIEEPMIDYNTMINTETGKEIFWSKLYVENVGIEHNVEIIKLINLIYNKYEGKLI